MTSAKDYYKLWLKLFKPKYLQLCQINYCYFFLCKLYLEAIMTIPMVENLKIKEGIINELEITIE